MNDTHPREWWIAFEEGSNLCIYSLPGETRKWEGVHVIEFSAFDAAIKRADVALENLKIAENLGLEYSREAAKWRDEYENLCKFATEYQTRAEAAELKLQFTNSNWPYEVKLHEEIERLIKEREELKLILSGRTFDYPVATNPSDSECSR